MPNGIRPHHPVYLVRHGRTALNAKGRFQGGLDEPLDDIGSAQAKVLAEKLHRYLPNNERSQIALQCSPLARAAMTMEIIAKFLNRDRTEVQQDGRLAEMGFGRWEGMTSIEVKARYPVERKQRKADRWNFRPSNGQSYSDIAGRIQDWFADQNEPVLAVTHLGVMRVAAVIAGGCETSEALALVPDPDEVWRFDQAGMARF